MQFFRKKRGDHIIVKIGIITLSASYNCGSMLQSYALKNILGKFGDVEIINFSSESSHRQYDIIPTSFWKKMKLECARKGIVRELKDEEKAYIDFQHKFLGILGKEYFANDLWEIADKYDVVVVGSDQVWNVCMSDFDEAFFCGWTGVKKVAYAPSLGGHDIRESTNSEQIIDWVKKFNWLSVREEVGKKCLDDILNEDVTKVLDPTLLYGDEMWKSMAGPKKVEGDYIFYYSWAYCYEELNKIVEERSKETGLPVYVIDAHKWKIHSYQEDGFLLFEDAGPLAFLNLMANATECYVESFHGMLFAYMFRRNFWLLDTHKCYEQLDSRLKELVELVGAEDRIVTQYNKLGINFAKDFSYGSNELLELMRQISNKYLEGALIEA